MLSGHQCLLGPVASLFRECGNEDGSDPQVIHESQLWCIHTVTLRYVQGVELLGADLSFSYHLNPLL